MKEQFRSGVVIAKLLATEGFTPFVASGVRKWFRKKIAHPRRIERQHKARRALSEMVKRLNLSDGDRIILGNFIRYETSAHFEAGLRIGLTTQMFPEDAPVPAAPQDDPSFDTECYRSSAGL